MTGVQERDRLGRSGRFVRLAVTAVGVAILLTGTLVGTDDHFPFGPFRMFATTNKWSEPISVARTEVVDSTGATIELTEANSGVRRAEVEGQIGRFRAEPALLGDLAAAYRAHNPRAAEPVRVRVSLRHHQIGRRGPTGHHSDEEVATWHLR